MLDSFATQLGVSAASLAQFGVGWVPIVEFKKGKNYQGWWCVPERDVDGSVVGLSLRSTNPDFKGKPMFPASKHGLVYPINPDHEQGARAYVPGRHNWVRTMDAGIDCPVCRKPDGCLLSAEDPEDPKSVICIRVREGATKPEKMGYLHILKPEGVLKKGATILPPSDHPVIIVEGMSDAAAALDLGFVAVGRPSNLAGLSMVADLARSRPVIIVGENDEINPQTGQRPGHEGLIATFQVLRRICPSCVMVLPPDHCKDLREWVRKDSVSQQDLLSYAGEHGRESAEDIVLPDNKPLTIARGWLDYEHKMGPRYTLRYHNNQWFRYNGLKYVEVDEKMDVRGPLYGWCDNKFVRKPTPTGDFTLEPLVCTRNSVNNIMDALLYPCPVRADRVPCWINDATGPDPRNLITFSNGVLDVEKYLIGADEQEYLHDLTPDLFTTFALAFPFNPIAKCTEWRRYLASTLGDDSSKVHLLREWFGYCLTPDTSLHKLMLLRGPRRSGKGTALAVLESIVGIDQCASINFRQLTERFGLQSLVGTQIAVMPDARLPNKADNMQALEVLLNIVGEDPVNIDRKYISPLRNHRLQCKFTIASNELPELPDHAGALEARLNIIDFKKSFLGQEDFGLRDKLIAEAPGIVVWALEGLRMLRDNGNRFTLPDESVESLREWRTTTSPVAAFLEECCDEEDGAEVLKNQLYDAWLAWATERGLRTWTKSKFFERIKSNAQFVTRETYVKGAHKMSVFRGIQLKDWAERKYLGRPG